MFDRKETAKQIGAGMLQGLGRTIYGGIIFLLGLAVAWFVSRGEGPGQNPMTRWDWVLITLIASGVIGFVFFVSVWAYPRVAEIWRQWFPGASTKLEPRATAGKLVGTPRIEWNRSGRIAFKGRYEYSGRDSVAYVTYASVGPGMPVREHSALTGPIGAHQPRIKLSTIARFDRGETADIDVGYVSSVDGNQEVLQWGEKSLGNIKVGITWASYFGHIILVEGTGAEHAFPFAIIERSFETSQPQH